MGLVSRLDMNTCQTSIKTSTVFSIPVVRPLPIFLFASITLLRVIVCASMSVRTCLRLLFLLSPSYIF